MGIKAGRGRKSLKLEKLVRHSPREREGGTEEGKDTANGLLTCLHTAPSPKKCKKNNHRVTKKYLVLLKGRRRCLFFNFEGKYVNSTVPVRRGGGRSPASNQTGCGRLAATEFQGEGTSKLPTVLPKFLPRW